ncbi:MAG: flagellar biosynthetic protein FliO [Lachnospiraceae bacterium]|nr:flagellar biosynthetic protein FliO [Lachnospiraceae bacterium]
MIIGSTSGESFIQFLVVLVIFAFVLLIAVFTTRFIGGYQKLQMQNKNMQILETMRVSNNKFLALVKVGKKVIMIGVGKDEINPLAEFTEDDIPDMVLPNYKEPDKLTSGFKEILDRITKKQG